MLQGELSAVTAAVEAGKAKVDGLGKLIAEKIEKNRNKKTFKITSGSPAG